MDDATLFYIIASGIAIVASGSILFLLWQCRPQASFKPKLGWRLPQVVGLANLDQMPHLLEKRDERSVT